MNTGIDLIISTSLLKIISIVNLMLYYLLSPLFCETRGISRECVDRANVDFYRVVNNINLQSIVCVFLYIKDGLDTIIRQMQC